MLVGQEDGVDGTWRNSYRSKASFNLPAGETGIDENVDGTVGDKSDVSPTAAGEYRDQEADGGPPFPVAPSKCW